MDLSFFENASKSLDTIKNPEDFDYPYLVFICLFLFFLERIPVARPLCMDDNQLRHTRVSFDFETTGLGKQHMNSKHESLILYVYL